VVLHWPGTLDLLILKCLREDRGTRTLVSKIPYSQSVPEIVGMATSGGRCGMTTSIRG
jgi:hypothetical protein